VINESDPRIGNLGSDEIKLARVLLKNNKITEAQLNEFLDARARFEAQGKRYLGDILVDSGYVKKEDIDEFFMENNEMYLQFIKRLVDEGFMGEDERNRIMADEQSAKNVVPVLESLGIMTKENFIQLFSKRVNSLRLGDWLLAKRKIDKEKLEQALQEQNANKLEGYLVHRKIVGRDLIEMIKQKLSRQ